MEGIIAVLNETVSNVGKSVFSGLKDLFKKPHTVVQDYAFLRQKKHGYTSLFFLGEHQPLFRFDC